MQLDPIMLSRVQFALTVGFHFLFPPLSIGLGLLMVIMEGRYMMTKSPVYKSMARFWTKIFGLIFAIGVASGIVMEFQFGTNWSTYSRYVGDIFGAALAAEGVFAFFLESGFLAVVVFGWDRVSPKMHFFSTIMVSVGSIFSAIWIIVANSWQQTPAGHRLVEYTMADGVVRTRAELVSFVDAVLNPSTLDRLSHVLIASVVAGSFLVLSVSAYYLLKSRHEEFARKSIGIALPFALVFSILTLVSGHSNAVMVGEHQPAKLAALEGLFETSDRAPLYILGMPDAAEERTAGLAIPGGLGFLMYGRWDARVRGFDQLGPDGQPLPLEDRPPIQLTFQSYHLMVALGMLMIVLSLVATISHWRGVLARQRWLLRILVAAVFVPLVAIQLGWIAAEVGRQPWIVYGLLRTHEAASPAVSGAEILVSIVLFGIIYALLLAAWLFILDRKIRTGPEPIEGETADATAT